MKSIALIGMSGVGKSHKGRHLAKELGWDFFDSDKIIVKRLGMSIDEIFEQKGEAFFREFEKNLLKELLSGENRVISTGGGIVIDEENISLLREEAVVVFLHSKLETIARNIENSSIVRPLLLGDKSMLDKVKDLYNQRESAYYRAAHVFIHVDNLSEKEVTRKIKEAYSLRDFNILMEKA